MMIDNNKNGRARLLVVLLPVLLAGSLTLGGCSNDPVSPQDGVPALSAGDVAAQAGYAAMAATIVGPKTIEFSGKSEQENYTYDFAGPVAGRVHLDYYTALGGEPATWQAGRYVELYTGVDQPLTVAVGSGGTVLLAFNVAADIAVDGGGNRTGATINGNGTFASGPYSGAFAFDGLAVSVGDSYPGPGTMTYTGGDVTATVTFNGTGTASLALSTGDGYLVDLDTGEISLGE